MTPLEQLQQWIKESRNIVFFGGAGVSTESGIPDFRSVDGLYNQRYRQPPETILSHTYFEGHTGDFYRFYRDKMICLDAKPNAAHRKLRAVVTQNIDGLHQLAGSQAVYELHGSVHRNYCTKCRAFYGVDFIQAGEGVPLCPVCGGVVKPDVVLYEEGLDQDTVEGAVRAIAGADVLIVGGTSLVVYPAAGLINYYRGNRLVLINRDPTPCDGQADLVIHDSIGKVLGGIAV